MSDLEVGPSSFSTLHFVPHFIKELLDQDHAALKQRTNNEHKSPKNHKSTPFNSSINIYSVRSNTNPRSINRKSVSDQETMAFVAMRDLLQISDDKLAKLYNYNKREYDTFQAVINNQNINYKHWINCNEVFVLYHLFARISGENVWIQTCDELGFAHYFTIPDFKQLFDDISKTQIRAKDEELFELRFFMKLLIFFWDNLNNHENRHNFAYFWIQTLSKLIKFIAEMAVGINIEIYCALTQQWLNATIIKLNKSQQQIYAQCLNGSNAHQWLSIFSPRLAPNGFKYAYIPNMRTSDNIPCIVAVVDDALNCLAPNHVSVRFQQRTNGHYDLNINTHVDNESNNGSMNLISRSNVERTDDDMMKCRIPKNGWYYKLDEGKQIGPTSIDKLFLSCVEREIDQNSSVYHQEFGVTTLRRLPHIVNFFRNHVQKCRRHMEMQQNAKSCSATSVDRSPDLSILTSTSNSTSFTERNQNVFIAESNINRFK